MTDSAPPAQHPLLNAVTTKVNLAGFRWVLLIRLNDVHVAFTACQKRVALRLTREPSSLSKRTKRWLT